MKNNFTILYLCTNTIRTAFVTTDKLRIPKYIDGLDFLKVNFTSFINLNNRWATVVNWVPPPSTWIIGEPQSIKPMDGWLGSLPRAPGWWEFFVYQPFGTLEVLRTRWTWFLAGGQKCSKGDCWWGWSEVVAKNGRWNKKCSSGN